MKATLRIGHVISVVAEVFGVAAREIRSERRDAVILPPRAAVCLLARELTDASYPAIGRMLGGRDHASIMNSERRCRDLSASDPAFALRLDAARQALLIMAAAGLTHLIEQIDAAEVARRIVASPRRQAMLATDLEIAAMAQLIVQTFGASDDAVAPFETIPTEETDHAA
jgi:Bacterial dnaA protein helix-turn-helix